jgi:hypothetical protein
MLQSNFFISRSFFFADTDAPMSEVPLALTPSTSNTNAGYASIAPSAHLHDVPQEHSRMGDDVTPRNTSTTLVPSPRREDLPAEENPEVPNGFTDTDAPMSEVPLALTPSTSNTNAGYASIAPSAQLQDVSQEDSRMGDDVTPPNTSTSLVPSPSREDLPTEENPEVPNGFRHAALALVTYPWGSGIVMRSDLSKVLETSHFASVGFHCLSLD